MTELQHWSSVLKMGSAELKKATNLGRGGLQRRLKKGVIKAAHTHVPQACKYPPWGEHIILCGRIQWAIPLETMAKAYGKSSTGGMNSRPQPYT